MSSTQELSNIYALNTNLIEVPVVVACELYTKLANVIWDLNNELTVIDTSNASEFVDELGNIITSDLKNEQFRAYCASGGEWRGATISVNLPFVKAQLIRLTRNAFVSLISDRMFSSAAHKQIAELQQSVIEVINSLFKYVPQQSEPVVVEKPAQEAERLTQMIENSNRYGVISLADARNVVRGLIEIDAMNDEVAGNAGQGLNLLITVLLEHISDNAVSGHGDLNNFLEYTNNGYVTLGIPCNHYELMAIATSTFSKLIDAMRPTDKEMAQIRSLETSFKQILDQFHHCLVANEIKNYASIG